MVLTGKREVDGRHCLTFLIIKKSSIDHFVRTAPVKKLDVMAVMILVVTTIIPIVPIFTQLSALQGIVSIR
uniref:Uncharacterized protein n=1 Tax=Parascaris equorum TaxID=6256 RepID=A0A914RR46_PAREQ